MEPAYPGVDARRQLRSSSSSMSPGRWPLRTTLLPRTVITTRRSPYSSSVDVYVRRPPIRKPSPAESLRSSSGSQHALVPADAKSSSPSESSPASSKESSESEQSAEQGRPSAYAVGGIEGSQSAGLTNSSILMTTEAPTGGTERMFTEVTTPQGGIGRQEATYWVQALTVLCLVSAAALATTVLVKTTYHRVPPVEDVDAYGNTKDGMLHVQPPTHRPDDNIIPVPFVPHRSRSTTRTTPREIPEGPYTEEPEHLTGSSKILITQTDSTEESGVADIGSYEISVTETDSTAEGGVVSNQSNDTSNGRTNLIDESVETRSASVEHSLVTSSVASSSEPSHEPSAPSQGLTKSAEESVEMSSAPEEPSPVTSSVEGSSEPSHQPSASSEGSTKPAEQSVETSSAPEEPSTVTGSVASSSEPSHQPSDSSQDSTKPPEESVETSIAPAEPSPVTSSVASSSEHSDQPSTSSHGLTNSFAESSEAHSAPAGRAVQVLPVSSIEAESVQKERGDGNTAAKRQSRDDPTESLTEEAMPWQTAGW